MGEFQTGPDFSVGRVLLGGVKGSCRRAAALLEFGKAEH
jgi:hypothetical protein